MYFPWDNIVFHGCSAVTGMQFFGKPNGQIVLGFSREPGKFSRMFPNWRIYIPYKTFY
jgi:hypothetical protein